MATEPERLEAAARPVAIRCRPARVEDAALILSFRNDRDLRALGNGREVTDAEHAQWWGDHAMDAAKCRLWIVQRERIPVGYIRFDRIGTAARVSLALLWLHRGQGIGPHAFRIAWSHRPTWAHEAVAEVRSDNPRALAFWRRLGFHDDGRTNDRLLLRYRPAA